MAAMQYLVLARGALDDIPLRIFDSMFLAEDYARRVTFHTIKRRAWSVFGLCIQRHNVDHVGIVGLNSLGNCTAFTYIKFF